MRYQQNMAHVDNYTLNKNKSKYVHPKMLLIGGYQVKHRTSIVNKMYLSSLGSNLADVIDGRSKPAYTSYLWNGIFSDELKIAKFIPTFKEREDISIVTYRPISFLTTHNINSVWNSSIQSIILVLGC